MTDRPILFSGPMVRAIRNGNKTQTRRILKPKPYNACGDAVDISIAKSATYIRGADGRMYFQFEHPLGGPLTAHVSQFNVGDRLWVRETFSGPHSYGERYASPKHWPTWSSIHYWADGDPEDGDWTKPKPGIHMPRFASRLTLAVAGVKVERLQDISHADAIAEGATSRPDNYGFQSREKGWSMNWSKAGNHSRFASGGPGLLQERDISLGSPVTAFASFINELHGGPNWNLKPRSLWDENPWVCAVSFDVRCRNIDAALTPSSGAGRVG